MWTESMRNGCVDRVSVGMREAINRGIRARMDTGASERVGRVAGPTKTRLKKGQFTETENFLSRRTALLLTCLLR